MYYGRHRMDCLLLELVYYLAEKKQSVYKDRRQLM